MSHSRAPLPQTIDTTKIDGIKVDVSRPSANQIKFSFQERYQYPNHEALFSSLRDILSMYLTEERNEALELTPEEAAQMQPVFLMIKYASRVHCSNFPLIHSPSDYKIYVDPLQMLRDPEMEVARTQEFILEVFPSRHYYYRPRTQVQDFPEYHKASARKISTPVPRARLRENPTT